MLVKKSKEERKALIQEISKLTEEQLKEMTNSETIITVDFHVLSLKNTAIALAQNPNAHCLGGYKQWRDTNRQVKKGEVAIWITAPVFAEDKKTIKRWVEVPMFDWSQTEEITPETK